MSEIPADWQTVHAVADACEQFAREEFGGDQFFTGVTRWQDGDFRIEVKHGHGYEDGEYRRTTEMITYKHFDGDIIYTKTTEYPDRRDEVIEERRVLHEDWADSWMEGVDD